LHHIGRERKGNFKMPAKRSPLHLVKSAATKTVKHHTDETVPQSGIYRVRHSKHRLPHEVTLLRDERFPRCAKCDSAVVFELVKAADEDAAILGLRICLYELPVADDEQEQKAAG
jgi:hypothetical protein